MLDHLFSHFDALAERHGLEKIKTIGDCYMVAAGVPSPRSDHARALALMALDMQAAMRSVDEVGHLGLELRVGINSGPVVAGVIGRKRFLYDLWGDAVNTASRMESHGTRGGSRSPGRRRSCSRTSSSASRGGRSRSRAKARWRPGTSSAADRISPPSREPIGSRPGRQRPYGAPDLRPPRAAPAVVLGGVERRRAMNTSDPPACEEGLAVRRCLLRRVAHDDRCGTPEAPSASPPAWRRATARRGLRGAAAVPRACPGARRPGQVAHRQRPSPASAGAHVVVEEQCGQCSWFCSRLHLSSTAGVFAW